MPEYWQGVRKASISRRRALLAAGGSVAGALLLACGGGSSSDKESSTKSSDKSGLLSKVVDTPKQAKPGGTYTSALAADILGLDPYQVTTGSAHAPYSYSRLVIYRPGIYPDPPAGSPVDPDAAES